jgi:anti-sigma regulatory factor (Ser/Thr protein kinase)
MSLAVPRFLPGAGGKGGCAGGPESVTVAGLAERAAVARGLVEGLLGPGHPRRADAALLVSELFGNAIVHGGSGAAGETVTVTVVAVADVMRVEVSGRSGRTVPVLRAPSSDAEGGRGLQLVARLADRWGWWRSDGRTVAWFELRHSCSVIGGPRSGPEPLNAS